jgi:hypothetical protein
MAIDIDGVVADTQAALDAWTLNKALPRIPVPTRYDYADQPKEVAALAYSIFRQPDFYAEMPPIPGAIPAVHRLAGYYTPVFITARAWHDERNANDETVKRVTRKWLERWTEYTDPTILFCGHGHKALLLTSLYHEDDIAFALEDNPATANQYRSLGVRCYVPAYPFNAGVEDGGGLLRVLSLWEAVFLEDRRCGRGVA